MALLGDTKDYDAVAEVIRRRGLSSVYAEVLAILAAVPIFVMQKRDANGAAVTRESIDAGFASVPGWRKTQVGGIDWQKEITLRSGNDVAISALSVEVQMSGRSVMIYRDISRPRMALINAEIDAGIIVVPNDDLAKFLTDRTPSFRQALETVQDIRADQVPIRIVPIGMAGFSDLPLPKKVTNLGAEGRKRQGAKPLGLTTPA